MRLPRRLPIFTTLAVAAPLLATWVLLALGPDSATGSAGGTGLNPMAFAAPAILGFGFGGGLLFMTVAGLRREPWGAVIGLCANLTGFLTISLYNAYEDSQNAAAVRTRMLSETWGASGGISNSVVLPDGRIALSGSGLAVLFPDGSLDTSFRHPIRVSDADSAIGIQQGSNASALAFFPPRGLLAISSSDSSTWAGCLRLDATHCPGFQARSWMGSLRAATIQPDGAVIAVLTGYDEALGKYVERRLLKLRSDGTDDPSFRPAIVLLSELPLLLGQPDGRIIVAGPLQGVDGDRVAHLVRLNPDGSLDRGFRPRMGDESVSSLAVTPDGGLLMATRGGGVFHLNAAGSESPTGIRSENITALAVAPDGTLLAGGYDLVRYKPGGRPDRDFHPPPVPNSDAHIRRILFHRDGLLVLDNRGRLARLLADGNVDPSFSLPVLRVYTE